MYRTISLTTAATSNASIRRDAAIVIAGALFIALCSRIEIPLYPVPITGQTFGVLFVGGALGMMRGTAAAALFVMLGLSGLPVFSGGACGPAHLFGPTGGYLAGFVAAAAFVSALFGRGFGRTFSGKLAVMAGGNLVIYLFGATHLAAFVGPERAFTCGVLPFLAGDLFKVFFAAALLPARNVR
ncbi:MAG TPA: biotin transporter BioY [Candidatus Ozemobacteraceae bacterium]|nr:biotin transporter BioY [Candidatus Ozemobacteraceae bacterium]